MTKVRATLAGLFVLFLMFEVMVVAPREIGVSTKNPAQLLSQDELDDQNQQVMKGVHLIEAKGQQRDWELWADRAFTQQGGQSWKLENVKVNFFGEGDVTYVVTGDRGVVEVDTKNVEVEGHIVMQSSNGYTFKTDHMRYDSLLRLIRTPDAIQMYGGRGRGERPVELVGTGLEANLGTNEILIQRDVRSKKQLDGSEYVYIESESVQLSAQSRFAKYMGDVTIDYKGARITGPSARFDYDPVAKAISSLVIEGGGRITDLTKWATAKTIQMLFRENKFILKGAPRVVQDNDELVGEEIVFLDGGKEIIVNRAKAEFTPRTSE